MNKVTMRFPGGVAKCLTLSYDDCVKQDIILGELMKKHGVAGTFNINSGSHAPDDGQPHRRLTQKQALEYFGSSPLFEVATHGLKHPFPGCIPTALDVYDIIQDRRNIEERYGTICRGHAYPYGNYSDDAVEILRLCGIVYARTTKSTYSFDMPTDWLRLHPTCHHKDKKLFELVDRFLSINPDMPQMFYLWGHTFEFDNDNNWNVIEKFLEKMSGRDDIWYATNIDIYDYTAAYSQLIYSADGSTVCNPTAKDIWICVSRKDIYKIPAGRKVRIDQ